MQRGTEHNNQEDELNTNIKQAAKCCDWQKRFLHCLQQFNQLQFPRLQNSYNFIQSV